MKHTARPNNGKSAIDKNGNDLIHFHVCNGGPTFLWNNESRTLQLEVSSEGWLGTTISVVMHGENLRELANWLVCIAYKIDEENK